MPTTGYPVKKYVYIGFNDNLPLTKFIESDLIPKYGNHIIFDRWSAANNEWTGSEPDTYHRVTAIWQDIAGDFDGDPLVILAILTPKQTALAAGMIDIYYFTHDKGDHAFLDGKEISVEDTKEQILKSIEHTLVNWERVP